MYGFDYHWNICGHFSKKRQKKHVAHGMKCNINVADFIKCVEIASNHSDFLTSSLFFCDGLDDASPINA